VLDHRNNIRVIYHLLVTHFPFEPASEHIVVFRLEGRRVKKLDGASVSVVIDGLVNNAETTASNLFSGRKVHSSLVGAQEIYGYHLSFSIGDEWGIGLSAWCGWISEAFVCERLALFGHEKGPSLAGQRFSRGPKVIVKAPLRASRLPNGSRTPGCPYRGSRPHRSSRRLRLRRIRTIWLSAPLHASVVATK
jgi:hypothetical protein